MFLSECWTHVVCVSGELSATGSKSARLGLLSYGIHDQRDYHCHETDTNAFLVKNISDLFPV
jgi:hypothetical protein